MVTGRTARFANSVSDARVADPDQQAGLRIPARMLAAWSEIAPPGVPAARNRPPMPSGTGNIRQFAAPQVLAETKEIDARLDAVEHSCQLLKTIAAA